MSNKNWTPGPWEICNTADIFTPLGATNAEGIEAVSTDGWHIADCDMGSMTLDEVRANAHLIAAAPDLYDALAEALADYDNWAAHEDNYPHEHLVVWAEKARAAIAKARGEP